MNDIERMALALYWEATGGAELPPPSKSELLQLWQATRPTVQHGFRKRAARVLSSAEKLRDGPPSEPKLRAGTRA